VRILDLFCGAGGAAMGYHRAGFEVVGVDNRPQPHYPFEFHQADAMTYPLEGFDAIHASPPCQAFSQAVSIANRANHPDLLAATRERLEASGRPYIIENVPTAPLRNWIVLCGSSFGLPIRRHRKFESNILLFSRPCAHRDLAYPPIYAPAWNRTNPLRVLSISGGYQVGEGSLEAHMAAMGIEHPITYHELSQAIPPAYTEWLGRQLERYLEAEAVGA